MPFASRVSRALPAALALLTFLSVSPAAAAWPGDPTVNVPLCTTAFSSLIGAAIPDGSGGAITVWYEDRSADFGVFARRVDGFGIPRWAANGVELCTAPAGSAQILPKAVSDGAGGVIAVWIDNRGGANALFAQRIDSSGTRLWAAAGVPVASTSSQVTTFDVAADGASGVVVTWAAQPALSSDIFAQRLNSSGAQQWTAAGRTLCNLVSDQFRPAVVRKASGLFVVVWEDSRQGFRTDLYGQALSTTGTAQWAANGLLVVGSASNAINPMLVATGTDDCLLMWDADSLGVGDVRAQRLGATGAALWPASGVRMFPAGMSGLLGVLPDGLGGSYAVISAFDAVSGKAPLWIQRVHDTGTLMIGAGGTRVSSVPSNQFSPVLARDAGNGCIVAWYDDQRNLVNSFDIYAQHVAMNGAALWYDSGVPVCRAANQGAGLAIAGGGASSSGSVIVAWSDTRASNSPDIYVQGVDANGVLGSGTLGVGPAGAPGATALARPSPNPAPGGTTNISYTLSAREHVRLQIIDPAGRIVGVLEDAEREAGQYHVAWDGRLGGHTLPPGLYLVQLRTESRSEIRRLVLL